MIISTSSSVRTRLLRGSVSLLLILGLAAASIPVYLLIVKFNLPPMSILTNYQPKLPLRVFTADNVLIGEFGNERRDFVAIEHIPKLLKQAVLATEDDRFYEHGALPDMRSVARVVIANLRGQRQGGGTITMQVARNFLQNWDKTPGRKLSEIMFALEIEKHLSKDQILELYMNQINMGERAYGFGNAARTYFGKGLQQLTLAEAAMLAGLPQRPSANNPIANPEKARLRQQHVLRRMRALNLITQTQHEQAERQVLQIRGRDQQFSTHAEYVAETVRQAMLDQFKEETYTRGLSVYTTIDSAEQDAAYAAVRANVLAYDRRHGYRGPEGSLSLPSGEEARDDAIEDALQTLVRSENLEPAVVLGASPKLVRAQMGSGEIVQIAGAGLQFAAAGLAPGARPGLKIQPGSVIRLSQDAKKKWAISQMPEVAAAFVALDAEDGAYRALVGGFDFRLQNFDHTRQAWRQPGSSIKPFIYSAALEKGFSPATVINDAPLVISSAENDGGPVWEPKNDDGFEGPLSLRAALAQSKNVPSVRILRAITPAYAQSHLGKFGFDIERHPPNLTMVLGTGAATPVQMARAYAIFANGGYQVTPYLISKIVDARGNLLAQARPTMPRQESDRVLDPRNAFIMDSLLREVVRSGSASTLARKLGRPDLAGKTGTTSDAVDGWFAGYGGNLVAVSWMGFDTPKSLGEREFGATLALPAWVQFMQTALKGRPVSERMVPEGLTQVNGDWMYQEFAADGGVRSLGMPVMPRIQESTPQPARRSWFDWFTSGG